MPPHNGCGLDNEKGGTPIGPDAGQQCPEDPIAFPEPWPFRALLQNRELLPESEVLGRKFRPVTQDPTNEHHKDANQPHFTASENPDYGPKTIAELPKASNRKSLVDKQFGINDRDNGIAFPDLLEDPGHLGLSVILHGVHCIARFPTPNPTSDSRLNAPGSPFSKIS